MPKEYLKARDKVVLKMTRDGAALENITDGTTEMISERLEEAELVQKAEVSQEASEPKPKRKQKPPAPKSIDAGSQPPTPQNAVEESESAASVPQNAQKAADSAIPKIERLERKSEKAHQRLEKAKEKLPKRKVLKKERIMNAGLCPQTREINHPRLRSVSGNKTSFHFDESTHKGKTRLFFDEEIKPIKENRLKFISKPLGKAGAVIDTSLHRKIHEAEQENSAVEGAHKTELLAEEAVSHYLRAAKGHANMQYERVSKLEHEAEKADIKLNFEKTVSENPELKKHGDMNKRYQKQRIKKQQISSRRGDSRNAENGVKELKKGAEKAVEKVKEFVAEHKMLFVWIGAIFLFIILFGSLATSCTSMFVQSGSTFVTSTYLSDDEDMLSAENAYAAMENALQHELDNYTATHIYDEYIFNLDEICHDPYVLISLLSAKYGGIFTLEEVQDFLKTLFEMQYVLTERVTVETRYRTETQIEYVLYIDPYTGQIVIDPYTGQPILIPIETQVQVPYDYYIVTVTLENCGLESLIEGFLDGDQMLLYEAYIETKGNREDLFP